MSFFATDDYSSLATFTSAGVSPVGLEAQNLASERVNNRWRVTGLSSGSTLTTLDVAYDDETAREINYLYIQRPRHSRKTELVTGNNVFAATDTIRIKFFSDEVGGTLVHEQAAAASGMLPGIGVYGLWFPSGLTFAAMQLEFNALSRADSPNNFMDMGSMRWGPAHQFSVDYIGLTEGLRSNSSVQRPSLGSSLYPRKAAHWRHWSLLFRCIQDSERAQVRDFLLNNYDGSQFVFGFDETNAAETWMLASIINPDLTRASVNFRRRPLELEEAL